LLHLPPDFLRQQPTFHEFMRFQLERGDFGPHGELLPKSVRAVVWESQDGGLSFSPNEYLRETKEGRILEVRTRRLDSGAYVRTFADVTDYVRAEREIRHLNESLELRVAERTADLERSMKDMEAISYSIAHDLRAPLRSVNGFATLIEQDEGDRLSANARDMFRRITLSASAMGRMIDDLLGLFRVMRAEPADDPVDMQALARAVADSLAPAWPKARVRVGALPPVRGDATLLRQLWSNLIDNALKYSAKSAEPRVEAGYHGPSRAYYVRDNGIGFDMAYAKKIFGVFQRMTVDQEGSGVGLAIVARIVERHAGRIWAQAVPGEGATFWFTIDSEAPSAQP
jgi:light-regulated signal transduction histidine kinase (bacteriophytochrome)